MTTNPSPLADLDYSEGAEGAQATPEASAPRKLDRAKVYICHPYSADPGWNTQTVKGIARAIVRALPHVTVVAPQLMLPAFMEDDSQRAEAMAMCIDLALACDELWVCNSELSEGMQRELEAVGGKPMRIRCFQDCDDVVDRLERGKIDPATVRPFDW